MVFVIRELVLFVIRELVFLGVVVKVFLYFVNEEREVRENYV